MYQCNCTVTEASQRRTILRIGVVSHITFRRGGACVKSNMVYTLCKHMVYMLSITNEHKNELEMRAKLAFYKDIKDKEPITPIDEKLLEYYIK